MYLNREIINIKDLPNKFNNKMKMRIKMKSKINKC